MHFGCFITLIKIANKKAPKESQLKFDYDYWLFPLNNTLLKIGKNYKFALKPVPMHKYNFYLQSSLSSSIGITLALQTAIYLVWFGLVCCRINMA